MGTPTLVDVSLVDLELPVDTWLTHMTHVFNELLEQSWGRKSIGNSKPTRKTSTSAVVAIVS